MAKAKEPEEKAADTPRFTFTTKRQRGSEVLIFQRPITDQAYVGAPIRTKQRAITVRLERGKEFDPFLECGPKGKNLTFRDVDPQKMHDFILSQIGNGHNLVCKWDDRPMTEDEKAFDAQVKAANKRADDQTDANERLKKVILDAGLKLPDGV